MTFTEKVYEIVSKIPSGKVATYGQIAALSGNKMAARAVGMCMHNNPDMMRVPCHRVVASDGSLTGYANGGIDNKKRILLEEGVFFNKDRVNLKASLWVPYLSCI